MDFPGTATPYTLSLWPIGSSAIFKCRIYLRAKQPRRLYRERRSTATNIPSSAWPPSLAGLFRNYRLMSQIAPQTKNAFHPAVAATMRIAGRAVT